MDEVEIGSRRKFRPSKGFPDHRQGRCASYSRVVFVDMGLSGEKRGEEEKVGMLSLTPILVSESPISVMLEI